MFLKIAFFLVIISSLTSGEEIKGGSRVGGYNSNYNRNYNSNFYNRGERQNQNLFYSGITNLRSENTNDGSGNFNYFYENSDGSVASQNGYIKAPRSGTEEPIQVQQGFYQYYAPDGQLIRVDYVADENGFQPKGDHLPTPPPIPEAIQKSLDLIYSNIEKQKLNPNYNQYNNNGQYKYNNNEQYKYKPSRNYNYNGNTNSNTYNYNRNRGY